MGGGRAFLEKHPMGERKPGPEIRHTDREKKGGTSPQAKKRKKTLDTHKP